MVTWGGGAEKRWWGGDNGGGGVFVVIVVDPIKYMSVCIRINLYKYFNSLSSLTRECLIKQN